MIRSVVAVWLCALLGGCGSGALRDDVADTYGETQDAIAAQQRTVDDVRDRRSRGALRRFAAPWVGDRVIPRGPEIGLPAQLRDPQRRVSVRVVGAREGSARSLVHELERVLGVAVDADPRAYALIAELDDASFVRAFSPGADAVDGDPGALALPGDPLGAGAPPRVDASRTDSAPDDWRVAMLAHLGGGFRDGVLVETFAFTGTVPELLDAASRALGFRTWRYRDGTVLLGLHTIREIPLAALAVGDAGDALIAEARDLLQRMCGLCVLAVQPHLGVVQIATHPALGSALDRYVLALNRSLGQQLVIDFEVYSVTREASSRRGIDFDLLLRAGSSKIQLGLGRALVEGGAAAPLALKNALVIGGGRLAGSQAVLDLLSKAGEASLAHSTTFFALNHRKQTVRFVNEFKIKIGTRVVDPGTSGQGDSKPVTEDIVEDFTDGFILNVLPRLLPTGKLLLHYALSLDLLIAPSPSLTEASDQPLVRSHVERRALANELVVPLGSRLLFNAYEYVRTRSDDSGSLHPGVWFPEGSASTARVVHTLVVSLRPSLARLRDTPA